MSEHGSIRTAKAQNTPKPHPPEHLAYVELFDTRSKAMKREREIKKLSHQQKLDFDYFSEKAIAH